MKIIDIIKSNRRPLLMLSAMTCGVVFHTPLAVVDGVTNSQAAPALIFCMLFITFCSVRLSQMSISKLHIALLVFQIVASVGVYYATAPLLGEVVAQGAMVCFLAPIAMGAVVVGGILGANVSSVASYSLLCNFTIAVVAPYILAAFGNGECTFAEIIARVAPLLIMPFVLAQGVKAVWPTVSSWIGEHGFISFYLWLFAMAITLGRTTTFILEYDGGATLTTQVQLALAALAACILQFSLGRVIGLRFGEPTTAGQSLGQKNTVLTVWLAHSFLDPISSIAPTAYIIWQNLINSIQIYLHDKKN